MDICFGCIYREIEDENGMPIAGCTHDFLYDEDGIIIPEHEYVVQENMINNNCSLKETK